MNRHYVGSYEVLAVLVRVQIRLHNVASSALRKASDLPLTHFEVLRCVADTEDCRVGTISRRLAISVGSASRTVDALVAAGLAERRPNPVNRRSSHLHATKAGRSMLASASPVLEDELARWLSVLSPSARTGLATNLGRVLQELEADGAGQPIG